MDNKKLYAFLKSAETGSQAAAADALGYTPSAVSQLVSSLEKELGLTLLERSSRGVSIVNELSARGWNDHIVKLPLDPPEKITFGIACRSIDQLSSAARRFLEYAVRYLTKSEE